MSYIDWNVDKDRIAWEDAKASGGQNGKGATPRPLGKGYFDKLEKIKGFSWSKEEQEENDDKEGNLETDSM